MSTRTYNLRTRTEAGPIDQSSIRAQDNPIPRGLSTSPVRDPPPHMMARPGPNTALYSEVVASRSPSPSKEKSSATMGHSSGPDADGAPTGRIQPEIKVIPTISRNNVEPVEEDTSGELSASPKEMDDATWTTVRRRRARSLESFDVVRQSHSGSNGQQSLTLKQTQVVNAATDAMTESQKEILKKRQRNLTHRRKDSVSSREEGTSKPKGKGIDPREWGNVNISQESLDVEAQAAAWRSLQKKNKQQVVGERKSTHRLLAADNRSPSAQLPDASRPVAQLARDSYLGRTLRNVGRLSPEQSMQHDGDWTPSSSEPSSSDSGDYDSDNSSSSEARNKRRRDNRHGRNGRRKRRHSSSSNKMVIKPIAPKEYNGSADARTYHRFVRESDAYLRDGKVKGRRRIFLLSHYLTDKAYDFYTQKVANNEAQWSLSQFYNELFNYCFPVDYRMQVRKALARCHQNDKSVAEYTHELIELFNMIGDMSERDQVLKFWNSSRPIIQKGLWRDNLNPEISSWASVVAQAEIIEISENVAERRDRRAGSSTPAGGHFSLTPLGGSSARPKNRHLIGPTSVRSVSYESKGHHNVRFGSQSHSNRSAHGTDSRSSGSRRRDHTDRRAHV